MVGESGSDALARMVMERIPEKLVMLVNKLRELGCDTFWELGPKRALTGMMKELAPGATALAVPSPGVVEQLPVS